MVACTCPAKQVATTSEPAKDEAAAFLADYEKEYQRLYYAADLAVWESQTKIVEGDDTAEKKSAAAQEALATYTGSKRVIDATRKLLENKARLDPKQVKQLETILFMAAENPEPVAALVKKKIAAGTAQSKLLYAFKYQVDGKEVTTNDIDEILRKENDPKKRLAAWETSKGVGPTLRDGLVELRGLRNQTVQALGFHDFFTYMVSEYGLTTEEMMTLVDQINRELRPLYRELHTWARYELAKRYNQPVPDLIPAHWLPNRWGQDWGAMVTVQGLDLDGPIAKRGAEWITPQAERFYVSLGFPPLPRSFYEKSSLYPVPPNAGYKKNNHASAWHLDLEHDVRSLMSIIPNTDWYETTHHELGHIYYYLSYTNPEVPIVLRRGANRAYHEAVGSLMGLAAMQPRFIQAIGLDAGGKPDPTQALLKEALNFAVFIPFATGTMARWEHDIYVDNLPPEKWNARWWELAARYQGIAPPSPRDETWCDACTKTHINDDPAGYYDYALSFVLLFQLHTHIAKNILKEDPHDTNYFARKDVGAFLQSILRPGASADWRELLRDKTGSDLTAKSMVEYFDPLMAWLKEQNKGRKHTLPEI
jgi:peptidyl-dipeptidase A